MCEQLVGNQAPAVRAGVGQQLSCQHLMLCMRGLRAGTEFLALNLSRRRHGDLLQGEFSLTRSGADGAQRTRSMLFAGRSCPVRRGCHRAFADSRHAGQGCIPALTKYCGADQKKGTVECIRCTGKHQALLPNCSDATITGFCSGMPSCYPTLAASCGHTKGQCMQCASCADEVLKAHAHEAWKCDTETISDFCDRP